MTVLISHVGIEGAVLTRAKANAKVKEETARLKAKHEGKILVAGLDPCQRLSGIALKLLAFERLLTEYECYRDTVVMVQRALLSGSRQEDEDATSAEVRELVARVNSKFGALVRACVRACERACVRALVRLAADRRTDGRTDGRQVSRSPQTLTTANLSRQQVPSSTMRSCTPPTSPFTTVSPSGSPRTCWSSPPSGAWVSCRVT